MREPERPLPGGLDDPDHHDPDHDDPDHHEPVHDDPDAWLSLDDLAQRCAIPARTVRFYRQNGLLDPPRRVGRRAFYNRADLDRLQAICQLRDRGLGLEAIARILEDPDGEHMTAIRRVAEELGRPWSEDRSATMSRLQVIETLGTERTHTFENLVSFGVIVPIGAPGLDLYHVPSVATLELAGDLKVAGLDAAFMYEAWQAMQRHLTSLARELVDLHAMRDDSTEVKELDELRSEYADTRSVAQRAVQIFFARSVDTALAEYVEASASVDAAFER